MFTYLLDQRDIVEDRLEWSGNFFLWPSSAWSLSPLSRINSLREIAAISFFIWRWIWWRSWLQTLYGERSVVSVWSRCNLAISSWQIELPWHVVEWNLQVSLSNFPDSLPSEVIAVTRWFDPRYSWSSLLMWCKPSANVVESIVTGAQVNRFGYRILREPTEKIAGSHRKTGEINGTWKQYSSQKFFRHFPDHFWSVSVGKNKNSPEIFPVRILIPLSADFLREVARTLRPGQNLHVQARYG